MMRPSIATLARTSSSFIASQRQNHQRPFLIRQFSIYLFNYPTTNVLRGGNGVSGSGGGSGDVSRRGGGGGVVVGTSTGPMEAVAPIHRFSIRTTASLSNSSSRGRRSRRRRKPKARQRDEDDNRTTSSTVSVVHDANNNNNNNNSEEQIEEILLLPIGGLDDDAWSNAKDILNTCRSSTLSFILLDRLVLEPDAATRLIEEEMLCPVVQRWSEELCDKPSSSSSTTTTIHNNEQQQQRLQIGHPIDVWKRVERYMNLGVRLSPQTFHRVIDGAHCFYVSQIQSKDHHQPGSVATNNHNNNNNNNINSPRMNKALFVDSIVQKMIDMSAGKKDDGDHGNDDNYPITNVTLTRYAVWAASSCWEFAGRGRRVTSDAYDQIANRMLELLQSLRALYLAGDRDPDVVMPSRRIYTQTMRFFSQKGDIDKVEELIEEMYGMYVDHHVANVNGDPNHPDDHPAKELVPGTTCFELLLYTYGGHLQLHASTLTVAERIAIAKRASDVLDRMLELEANQELPDLIVTSHSIDTVLWSWSKCFTSSNKEDQEEEGEDEARREAQALYHRAVELSKTDSKKVLPRSSYRKLRGTSVNNNIHSESHHMMEGEKTDDDDDDDNGPQSQTSSSSLLQSNNDDHDDDHPNSRGASVDAVAEMRVIEQLASPLLHDKSLWGKPSETLNNYAQKTGATLDAEVLRNSRDLHLTRVTYQSAARRIVREGTGGSKKKSKAAACLAILKDLKDATSTV